MKNFWKKDIKEDIDKKTNEEHENKVVDNNSYVGDQNHASDNNVKPENDTMEKLVNQVEERRIHDHLHVSNNKYESHDPIEEEEVKSRLENIKDNVFGKTMDNLWHSSPVFKVFLLGVLALFAWYLYVMSGLHGFIIAASISLIPFVVGFLLALLPHPLTIKVQKIMNMRKIRKAKAKGIEPNINSRLSLKVSGVIVFVINMGILVGLLYVMVPLIYNQFNGFLDTLMSPDFKERFEEFLNEINLNIDAEQIEEWYTSIENLLNDYFSTNGFSWFASLGGSMMSILMGFAIGFYLIHDWKNYSDAVTDAIFPHKTVEAKAKDRELRGKIRDTLVSWSKGFMLDQLFIFSLTAILLYFLGVPEWFILALVMVLLNTIPFIGPIIGGVIIVGFLFVNNVNGIPVEHFRGWWTIDSLAVIIIGSIGVFAIQTIESIWWIPKVYNKTLNIHPATILIALGLAGIMISPFVLPLVIPSIAVGKTIYKHKTGREIRL